MFNTCAKKPSNLVGGRPNSFAENDLSQVLRLTNDVIRLAKVKAETKEKQMQSCIKLQVCVFVATKELLTNFFEKCICLVFPVANNICTK